MTVNNEKYYLKVLRISRLLIGILVIGIIAPSLYPPFHGIFMIENDYVILALIGLIVLATYYLTFGKICFSYIDDEIQIDWIRKIPFEKDLENIKIKDVTVLVIDNEKILRLIFTKNRKIVIQQRPISNSKYHLLLKKIIERVEENGGSVITYKKYLKIKGFYDLSFEASWLLLIAAIVVISRTWMFFKWYSLITLIIPLFAYYRHLKKRIKRKKSSR